jgi:hypothetical protein
VRYIPALQFLPEIQFNARDFLVKRKETIDRYRGPGCAALIQCRLFNIRDLVESTNDAVVDPAFRGPEFVGSNKQIDLIAVIAFERRC